MIKCHNKLISFIFLCTVIHNVFCIKENDFVINGKNSAYVTFMYDYAPESADLLLSVRVLMQSIKSSNTKYRRIVVLPNDGASEEVIKVLELDNIEVYVSNLMSNAFKGRSLVDPIGNLEHMKNKLILWNDPKFNILERIVYLDPENIVLRNMDEVFACTNFCAVDNGQSIVYSNSLMVINPKSKEALKVYKKSIADFEINGKPYDYIGIVQGFVPGLFEAIEESPFFNVSMEPEDTFNDKDADQIVVRRLPYYYSINHMVYYERLNWDLYQCNNPMHSSSVGTKEQKNNFYTIPSALDIPGPLLSFKYHGESVKPWFWLSYVYFNIFWYWIEARDQLNENHSKIFIAQLTSYLFWLLCLWCLYALLIMRLARKMNINKPVESPQSQNSASGSTPIFSKQLARTRSRSSSSNAHSRKRSDQWEAGNHTKSNSYVSQESRNSIFSWFQLKYQQYFEQSASIATSKISNVFSGPLSNSEVTLGSSYMDSIQWYGIVVGNTLVVVGLLTFSIYFPPTTMHPLYACKFWWFIQITGLWSIILFYKTLPWLVGTSTFTVSGTIGSTISSHNALHLLFLSSSVSWKKKLQWIVQPCTEIHFIIIGLIEIIFLKATSPAYFNHPVLKPVVLIVSLGTCLLLQLYLLSREAMMMFTPSNPKPRSLSNHTLDEQNSSAMVPKPPSYYMHVANSSSPGASPRNFPVLQRARSISRSSNASYLSETSNFPPTRSNSLMDTP